MIVKNQIFSGARRCEPRTCLHMNTGSETGNFFHRLYLKQRKAAALLAATAVFTFATPAWSATGSEEALQKAEVEAWANELFELLLTEHRISAGAIAVTQGDEVILSKGFGYSDWNTTTPAESTSQFRIASLTKTFLSTAIAQLVEQGKIASLDDPVNKYLTRFQLPGFIDPVARVNRHNREITIWDLLTHQGGLGRIGIFPPDGAPRPVPLLDGDYIIANTPKVLREPGTLSIYCNPCTSTLGFMVEDITGMTLPEYLKEYVLEPLGMNDTILTNSPDPDPNMVTQFAFEPGKPPVALPYPAISPYVSYAGDMNSTADDMSKWLISNIRQGRGQGPSVMSPESYQLLHTRHRGNHPDTSGFGMKFFTYDYNDEPVLEHYGSLQFRSLELMMLEKEIGVFITVAGGGLPGEDFAPGTGSPIAADATVKESASHSGMRAVVLEYFLGPLKNLENPQPDQDLTKFLGVYDSIAEDPRADWRTGNAVSVELSGDGGLVIGGIGVYRPAGRDAFILDGPLPLETAFRFGNRYHFSPGENGAMRMFPHVNAGGFQRRED